jgi:hypothetical protein
VSGLLKFLRLSISADEQLLSDTVDNVELVVETQLRHIKALMKGDDFTTNESSCFQRLRFLRNWVKVNPVFAQIAKNITLVKI